MKPSDIKASAYLYNLGADWIAVDARGNVLCRAGNEDAVRRGAPDAAAYFNGKDLSDVGMTAELVGAAPGSIDAALNLIKNAVADATVFDKDGDGKAGGSPKGELSTAHIGAERKKAKAAKAKTS